MVYEVGNVGTIEDCPGGKYKHLLDRGDLKRQNIII